MSQSINFIVFIDQYVNSTILFRTTKVRIQQIEVKEFIYSYGIQQDRKGKCASCVSLLLFIPGDKVG